MTPIRLLHAVLFAGLMLVASAASGQELEVRAYANVPTGMNFVAFGYAYSHGKIALDPNLPSDDLDARLHAAFASYVCSLSLFGLPSKLSVTVPVASGRWGTIVEGEFQSRDITGLGDMRVAIATIFAGAPARKKKRASSRATGRGGSSARASLSSFPPGTTTRPTWSILGRTGGP